LRKLSAFQTVNRFLTIAVITTIPACQGGHDASQLVKEQPSIVYAGFESAFSENSFGGAKQYSNLWHGGMQTFVEKTPGSKLDVVTKFDGETASEAHFTFTPADGGKATLVQADVNVDQDVMRKAFAGSERDGLGNLPKAAFAQGMQRLMAKYASRIESGMPLNLASEGWQTGGGEAPPQFYEGMPEDMRADIRRHDEEERQEASTAPMVDPNAEAQAYLHPSGPSN
jgi:hypothetical protein